MGLSPPQTSPGAILCLSSLPQPYTHNVLLRYLRSQSSRLIFYPSFLTYYSSFLAIQHRSLQPTVPPTQGPAQQPSHTRLSECFEIIRSEFDVLTQDIGHLRNQRDEFDTKGSFLDPLLVLLLPPTACHQLLAKSTNSTSSVKASMISRLSTEKYVNNMKRRFLV